MENEELKEAEKSGLWRFMGTLHPAVQGFVAAMFLFTMWSVLTGFPLGEILSKYADGSLEQNKMQFEAQLRLQELQFQATETSNQKLDDVIAAIGSINENLKNQSDQIQRLTERMSKIEGITNSIAKWTCDHEVRNKPGYCIALSNGENDG